MIPEHKYAYYYWLKCVDFSPSEFTKIVEAITNAELNIIDGFDDEDHSFCIKIKKFIPSGIRDVKYCQKRNEEVGKKFIRKLQQNVGGKFYLNVNRKQLKWID